MHETAMLVAVSGFDIARANHAQRSRGGPKRSDTPWNVQHPWSRQGVHGTTVPAHGSQTMSLPSPRLLESLPMPWLQPHILLHQLAFVYFVQCEYTSPSDNKKLSRHLFHAIVCPSFTLFPCTTEKGEREQQALGTKQAGGKRASTFTRKAQRHHHESISQ